MKTLILLFAASLAWAQGTSSTARVQVTGYTVSGLSGFTPLTGMVVPVTDGASAVDCTSGGGSALVWCRYNGSAWAAFSHFGTSKSGNSNVLGTVTGALTTGKQLAFDPNGNIIASDEDLGGGSASGTFQSTITDLKATRTSGTVLTIGAGMCWDTAKSSSMTLTITGGSGNGSWVAYCNDAGAVVVLHSTSAGLTVTPSGLLAVQVTTPEIPEGAQPIAEGTITTGNWDTTVTDLRTWSFGNRFVNGTGFNAACATGVCTLNVDTAVVQTKTDTLTTTGAVDVTGATRTEVFREATSDPGTCSGTEVWRRTDTGELKHCVGGVATVIGAGGAPTITSDLYWPFGAPSDTGNNLNPGANVQRAYKFTPLANYTFSKIRYKTSGTGYVAFAIVTANGNTIVSNSSAVCNNATAGAGQGFECSLAGTVSLTAGTSYYFVFTADSSTGIVVSNAIAGDIGYAVGNGFGTYVGQAANNSTGSAGTLAVSVPLGTISPITGNIAGNQPPAIVFVP